MFRCMPGPCFCRIEQLTVCGHFVIVEGRFFGRVVGLMCQICVGREICIVFEIQKGGVLIPEGWSSPVGASLR
jgi:hypothetical protein